MFVFGINFFLITFPLKFIMCSILFSGVKVRRVNVNSFHRLPFCCSIRLTHSHNLHLAMNGPSKSFARRSQVDACVNMFELNIVVPAPVLSLAHNGPNIPSVTYTTLTKSRNLLHVCQWTWKVMGVKIPLGGQMFKADLLSTLHWISSCAHRSLVGTFDGPVTVDILLHIVPCDRLLAWSWAIFDIMAV